MEFTYNPTSMINELIEEVTTNSEPIISKITTALQCESKNQINKTEFNNGIYKILWSPNSNLLFNSEDSEVEEDDNDDASSDGSSEDSDDSSDSDSSDSDDSTTDSDDSDDDDDSEDENKSHDTNTNKSNGLSVPSNDKDRRKSAPMYVI